MSKQKLKDQKIKDFRISLNEDEVGKIEELQEITGIQNWTDIFRLCLTFTHTNYPKTIKI